MLLSWWNHIYHHCTNPMEHRFTRQELYDRIWSTPMTRVAAELGTTPGRLSSLIRRAGIPTPPSGYWIKKEFGKAETQPPLPPAPPDCFEPLVLDTNADTTRAPRPETAPRKAEPEAQPLSEFEAASAPAAPPPPPTPPAPRPLRRSSNQWRGCRINVDRRRPGRSLCLRRD
jgi:hypothetical protein